jgi:hypothetical protein
MDADALDGLPFAAELCTKSGGYEVAPDEDLGLDLEAAGEALEEDGLDLVTDAGVVLVVDAGPCQVSVFESGRLLAKTEDASEAEPAARAVYEALGVLA